MIEPKEPITFDYTPAWSPVGLEWVTEERHVQFRLQSIDSGEVHGRIRAKHRGRDWLVRNLSIPTPKTGAQFGDCYPSHEDYNAVAEWTYIVEFRGNPHAGEFRALGEAVLHLATLWDRHEEEFNELRMLKRLQRIPAGFPIPISSAELAPSTRPEGYPIEELKPVTIRFENGDWWATTRATSFAGFLVTPLQYQWIERNEKQHMAYSEWLQEVARQARIIDKTQETKQ